MIEDIRLYDVLQLKKPHACGANKWQIIRFGVDCKLQCMECGRIVMIERIEVKKRAKKILERKEFETNE